MKLSQENKKAHNNTAEHLFKYIAEAHPGINECPSCGIGYGLYEYRNKLTNEKVFSCRLCIKKLTKAEYLQKIITFTKALVNKKIWLEQYINELDNWLVFGHTFLTTQELRELRKEANRRTGLK